MTFMNTGDMHRYDDIIMLPHHVSKTHPPMPAADRAAQFAPFAALTEHGAVIRKTETSHVSEDMERIKYEEEI
mgnify:CR=1 FL=1